MLKFFITKQVQNFGKDLNYLVKFLLDYMLVVKLSDINFSKF